MSESVADEVAEPVAAAEVPVAPDAVLLASVDVARDALLTITDAASIGETAGHIAHDEHTLSLLFECRLPGYPGWHWAVTLGRADDTSAPTVLETELMPGENALLAPEWVPWADRLAEYQAAQEAAKAEDASDEDDEDDEDTDDDTDEVDDDDEDADEVDDDVDEDADLDDEDADQLGTLHAGDIDGVDIDEIEEDADEIEEDAVEIEEDADDSAPVDAEVDEPEDSESDSDEVGPEPGQPVLADEASAEHDE